jgi:hypothetical protein
VSRDLVLRPEAEEEVAEAFDWYEDQMPGLDMTVRVHPRG